MFERLQQNRKLVFIIGGVLLLAIIGGVIFAATRPKQAANKIVVPEAPIKLIWWKTNFDEEVYKDIISEFEKLPQNKNVKIDIIKKPNDDSYYRSFILDFARDTGPDIFTINNDDLPAYKEFCTPIENVRDTTGATVPNTKLIADYREKFVDLAVKETLSRNQLFAVTSYIENLQLYYNESLLSQAGIVNPPTTWSELDKQLSLLNKRETSGINFKQHAIAMGTGITQKGNDTEPDRSNINRYADIIPLLLFQNQGQMYDYNTKKILFGSSAQKPTTPNPADKKTDITSKESPAFQALNFFNSFSDINSSRYSWNSNANDNIKSFTEGRLAYMLHYSYMQDKIKAVNPSLKYSIAKLPQLDENNKKTFGFFKMDCASAQLLKKFNENKKNPVSQRKYQVAKDFLFYLTTAKAQEKFSNKTGLPSAHKDVIAKQQFGNKNSRIFAAGALFADNYYKPDVKRTEKLWGDILYRTQFERKDLAQSLQVGINEYTNIVSEGPKPRY
jgi:maltose-binding protein MalE